MPRSLPQNPSLRYLKEEAKDLLKAHRSRDPACCLILRHLHRFADRSDDEILAAEVGLQEMQFALAMEYGFGGWDHLVRAVALREYVLARLNYWERFGPAEGFDASPDGKVQGILADPEWVRLAEMEMALGELSEPCRKIRRQIACMEGCHESYDRNVESILRMIGTMTPGQIFDCGWACEQRRAQAAAYACALEVWLGQGEAQSEEGQVLREVSELLGQATSRKVELAGHLLAKLRQNSYKLPGDRAANDPTSIEFRIQHLEICNFNWPANVGIVLKEIAADRQIVPWHRPDGFNAHGDARAQTKELRSVVTEVTAWMAGAATHEGTWQQVLGEPTPEKRWLAGCLCKNVLAQSADHWLVADWPDPALRMGNGSQ